jgi:hypothetical protein
VGTDREGGTDRMGVQTGWEYRQGGETDRMGVQTGWGYGPDGGTDSGGGARCCSWGAVSVHRLRALVVREEGGGVVVVVRGRPWMGHRRPRELEGGGGVGRSFHGVVRGWWWWVFGRGRVAVSCSGIVVVVALWFVVRGRRFPFMGTGLGCHVDSDMARPMAMIGVVVGLSCPRFRVVVVR